jgi:ABC-2 type transport system permease protein
MNLSTWRAAFAVEARKTAAARVTTSTTVLLVVGIAGLASAMTAAARTGDAQVLAKLGPVAAQGGWNGLVSAVIQITAAAGLLGFGVVLSWMLGREFADGTVTGLFGLPVSRATIALAKLAVYLLWSIVVALALCLVVLFAGLAFGLGLPDATAMGALARLLALAGLSALLAVPAAWAATIGRGLLPGIAATVGIITLAQVMVVAGLGGWFPLAAPALWAISPADVSAPQLALVAVVPAAFGLLTLRAWATLQLDR